MATPKQPRFDKRQAILDTALQLFIEKGYLETKISDIAEAAGIAKGSVYGYFPSKEELFTELLRSCVLEPYQVFVRTFEGDPSPNGEKLRRFVRFEQEIAQRFGNGKNYIDLLYLEKGLARNPGLSEVMGSFLQLRFSLLARIVREGMDAGEFAPRDPALTTLALMGAIGMYISHQCGLLSHTAIFPPVAAPAGGDVMNDFFGLLLNGLTM